MATSKKSTTKKKTVSKKTTASKKVAKKTTKKTVAKKAPVKKKAAPAKKKTTATKKKGATAQPQDFAPYKAKSNEDYMNEAQKVHFREILLEWKQNLMQEVDKTVHHMKDDVTNFPDPNDRATQEEEFSLELRARDRERKLIKKIDESINDIENDDYGYCEACGVEIGVKRLEVRPTATLCIDCKTLEEIKEKQTRA